jgi:hypothetical protein
MNQWNAGQATEWPAAIAHMWGICAMVHRNSESPADDQFWLMTLKKTLTGLLNQIVQRAMKAPEIRAMAIIFFFTRRVVPAENCTFLKTTISHSMTGIFNAPTLRLCMSDRKCQNSDRNASGRRVDRRGRGWYPCSVKSMKPLDADLICMRKSSFTL